MASAILSVIVVTYKSRDEIVTCLNSIPKRINNREAQIIVVDNNSGDDSQSLIEKECSGIDYIQLAGNFGFSRANNIGYEHANGEFILFLNPDTVSNETAYQQCLNRLENDQTIGVISPKLVMADGQMDLACRRKIPTVWDGFCRASGLARTFPANTWFAQYNLTYLDPNHTYEVGAVNGAFMMCPRRVLTRIGLFDEQFFLYGEDLDLCYRCQQAGYKIIYDGRVHITHFKGISSSKESVNMTKAVFKGTKQFYHKHFNPTKSKLVQLQYDLLFKAWEMLALFKAKIKGHQKAQPL